jgi:hypothetical protein
LKALEMPRKGKYFIPSQDFIIEKTNEGIINSRGAEEGKNFVYNTGRVTGWFMEFFSNRRAAMMPKEVSIQVVEFRTVEGAQLALTKYNYAEISAASGWNYATTIPGLGDKYVVTKRETVTTGGDKEIGYSFEYTYRNYLVTIGLYDLEAYVSHDFALLIGQKVLKKLEAAPLVYPSTATPIP